MKILHNTGARFDVDETASRRLLDDILSRPLFAHLATHSEHGPRDSPVCFEGTIDGTRHVADGRNTFIFSRTSEAWKVIHYHESGPGPKEMAESTRK
jgi:hypothetical protein